MLSGKPKARSTWERVSTPDEQAEHIEIASFERTWALTTLFGIFGIEMSAIISVQGGEVSHLRYGRSL